MNFKLPENFYFKKDSGKSAALLLHGFTGNTSDVRQLGRFFEKKGMTAYSFNYEGHAEHPKNITKSSPYIWYKQAVDAYDFLKGEGYEDIFVVGVSIGGVLALNLSLDRDVTGVATVCSPMYLKDSETLYGQFTQYAEKYLRMFEKLTPDQIDKELEKLEMTDTFEDIRTFIKMVKGKLEDILIPTFVAQGEKDEVINPDSANIIFDNIGTEEKELEWYKDGGHVLTIDQAKGELFEDIYRFTTAHDLLTYE